MSIIQFCADPHLNIARYGRIDSNGMNFRTLDFLSAFERNVDKAISEIKPQYFCILGDVYDHPNPSSNIREFFQDQVVKLVNNDINVVILVGNHDICKFHYAVQPLKSISKLKNLSSKILVVDNESVLDVDGFPLLLMFPYPMSVERQEKSIKDVFFGFCDKNKEIVKKNRENNRDVIFIGHFGISGTKMNDGYVNLSSQDIQIKDLDRIGANYVLLGHYHGHQKISSEVSACYVGSLERTDFSDLESTKGCVIYDDSLSKKFKFINCEHVRPLIIFEGNSSVLLEQIKNRKQDLSDAIVKIKFVGDREEYKDYKKDKKIIRDILEKEGKIKHVIFEQKISDETQKNQADAIRREIEKIGHLEADDIEKIIENTIQEIIVDKEESNETLKEIRDIISTVKSTQTTIYNSQGGKSSVLVLGARMHNFLRYGEDDNIVEFEKDAKNFLDFDVKKISNEKNIEEAKKFVDDVLARKESRVTTIIGMTDGDERTSNGSGKSTIFEAISYGFYGRLIREYVRRPESKGESTTSIVFEEDGVKKREAFVDILFVADKALWLLRRGRKLSKSGDNHTPILSLWCLSEKENDTLSHSGHRTKDDSKTIADLVKMSFDTFVNSIMYGQNDSGKFITGSDKTRKEIIINVLQLGIIDNYLKECRERKRKISEEIISLKAQTEAFKSANCYDIEELNRKIESNIKRISEIDKSIDEINKNIEGIKQAREFSSYDAISKDVELKKVLLNNKIQEVEDKKNIFNLQIRDIKEQIISNTNELNNVRKDIKDTELNVENLNKKVESFNEENNRKQMGLVDKAKQFKPIRLAEKEKIEKENLELAEKASTTKEKIRSVDEKLTDFERKVKSFEKGEDIYCSDCEQKVSKEHVVKKIEEKKKEKEILSSLLRDVTEDVKKIAERIREINLKISNIESQISKEVEIVSALSNFKNNKDKIEECKKLVVKYKEQEKKLLTTIEQLKNKINDIVRNISEIDNKHSAEIKIIKNEYDALLEKLNNFEKVINELKNKIFLHEKDIKDYTKLKEEFLTENGQMKNKIEEQIKTNKNREVVAEKLVQAEKKQNRYVFIDGIFGIDGIQTKLVEKYIPILNEYIDEFLEIISAGRTKVEIITDGKIGGKVDIRITGDSSSDCFLLSGGEGIRIKLAISLGLGLLSFIRTETSPEFIALDEVFSYVDEQTKECIFLIIDKLKSKFRDIFVVSHDKSIVDRIQNVIVVNKVNGVSKIEKQFYEIYA